MAVKFETVIAGDVLYDCHRHRMGNTTATEMGVWRVDVISVDSVAGTAQCSWNGNRAETYSERDFHSLRRWPVEWSGGGWGRPRLCYVCHGNADTGHKPDCQHPRAVAARKRAAKAVPHA